MNSFLLIQTDEVDRKMDGYTVLLSYRYMNLCVKAEIASLMPVSVIDEGTEFDIEEVADVAIANEYQMVVYPKYPELLTPIVEGIAEAHPEFKLSVKKGRMSYVDPEPDDDDNDDSDRKSGREPIDLDKFPAGEPGEDNTGLFLVYTMPDVDKNRRDLLTAAVKSLHAECMMRIDSLFAHHAEIFTEFLANTTSLKDGDLLKNRLTEIYDHHKERADMLRDDKLQEIDDAYARYTLKQGDADQPESDLDYGDGTSMNLKDVWGAES